MKTKFFITTLLFLIGGLCLKAQTNDTDTQKAIATLKEFYKVIYDDNSWKEEQFLKYVSKELFNKCFLLSDWEKKKTCVDYQLKKNNKGKYMITNILSDKNFYIEPKKKKN